MNKIYLVIALILSKNMISPFAAHENLSETEKKAIIESSTALLRDAVNENKSALALYLIRTGIKVNEPDSLKNKLITYDDGLIRPHTSPEIRGEAYYPDNIIYKLVDFNNKFVLNLLCQYGAKIDSDLFEHDSAIITPLSYAVLRCEDVAAETLLLYGAQLKPSRYGKEKRNPKDFLKERIKKEWWSYPNKRAKLSSLFEMEQDRRLELLKNLKSQLHHNHEFPKDVAQIVCDYTFNKEELE